MGTDKKKREEQKSLTPEELVELAILQEELNQLKKEQGLVEEKKGFGKFISEYFGNKEERKLSVVNKRKYLYFLIFTGWCGGHHFYAKRYTTGLTYLLFFWSGFPLAMAIADWLVWLPKVPDENGNIEI